MFFELFDRLRHFEILTHFSDEQIDLLATCTSMVRYSKGSKILGEGEEVAGHLPDRLGRGRDPPPDPPFGPYPFARLKAGDVFGETSFIDNQPRSGDAFVVEDAVIFPLNALALAPVAEEHRAGRWPSTGPCGRASRASCG